MTPIEQAVAVLEEAGYRRARHPLPVASTNFDFDTVMTIERSLDLVVLVDTAVWSEDRTRRQIQALGRALDVLGSRRTLTLILVGPEPTQNTLEALTRVCRVLPVGAYSSSDHDQHLRDWLAVLLPLTLPEPDEDSADWRQELQLALGSTASNRVRRFIDSAIGGKDGVRQELRISLEEALGPISAELDR